MQIPNQFLEDEVRDGFFISSKIKRAWANGLWLLAELDRICEANNIIYSLDWGTLLGAVRHGGMIPWDDDFDVVMHRNELKKFIYACEQDSETSFNFVTFENNDYHWKFIVSISHNERMCFEPEYLKKHFNFPYISSIDIFVLDNVSDDEEEERIRDERVKKLLNIDNGIEHGDFSEEQLKALFTIIENEFQEKINEREDINSIRRKILRLALNEMQKFNNIETKNVSQIVPWGMNGKLVFPRAFYEKTMKVPFENIESSVPIYADEILKKKYGEYQRIVKGTAGHVYPFYEAQKAGLGTDLDIYPHYGYKMVENYEFDDLASLKNITNEYLQHLDEVIALFRTGSEDEIVSMCTQEQEVAIDYGTLVENVKGEGTKVVVSLENYCELLYNYIEGGCSTDDIVWGIGDIKKNAKESIFDREEILFLTYNAKCWTAFDGIYEELKSKNDKADIYIMPLPYGYKEYDGSISKVICEYDGYPEKLNLINYVDYDFSLHCPEEVYIQIPYDQYSTTISTLPQLYVSNIRPYVKKMVYVPYLKTTDFIAGDEIQTYNIKDYVCSPGVVLSDVVILESEAMKDRYVELLTQWGGDDTKNIWNEKIKIGTRENLQNTLTDKVLLFYCSVSSLLCWKEKYIAKIKENIKNIEDSKIKTIVVLSSHFYDVLEKEDSNLLNVWNNVVGEMQMVKNISMNEDYDMESIIDITNAYYGEVSLLSTKMMCERKPVMIRSLT